LSGLQRLNVFSLPAFRPLGHVELHGLALLQALEAACLDRREVHKNILAILTADEAVAFGVIEPLYCSLFCHVDTGIPFNRFTLERLGGIAGRLLAVEARTAHDRLGLTYTGMVREGVTNRKLIVRNAMLSMPWQGIAKAFLRNRRSPGQAFATVAARRQRWRSCVDLAANRGGGYLPSGERVSLSVAIELKEEREYSWFLDGSDRPALAKEGL
jgi:hypothetical protein